MDKTGTVRGDFIDSPAAVELFVRAHIWERPFDVRQPFFLSPI